MNDTKSAQKNLIRIILTGTWSRILKHFDYHLFLYFFSIFYVRFSNLTFWLIFYYRFVDRRMSSTWNSRDEQRGSNQRERYSKGLAKTNVATITFTSQLHWWSIIARKTKTLLFVSSNWAWKNSPTIPNIFCATSIIYHIWMVGNMKVLKICKKKPRQRFFFFQRKKSLFGTNWNIFRGQQHESIVRAGFILGKPGTRKICVSFVAFVFSAPFCSFLIKIKIWFKLRESNPQWYLEPISGVWIEHRWPREHRQGRETAECRFGKVEGIRGKGNGTISRQIQILRSLSLYHHGIEVDRLCRSFWWDEKSYWQFATCTWSYGDQNRFTKARSLSNDSLQTKSQCVARWTSCSRSVHKTIFFSFTSNELWFTENSFLQHFHSANSRNSMTSISLQLIRISTIASVQFPFKYIFVIISSGGSFPLPPTAAQLCTLLPPPGCFRGPFVAVDLLMDVFSRIQLPEHGRIYRQNNCMSKLEERFN